MLGDFGSSSVSATSLSDTNIRTCHQSSKFNAQMLSSFDAGCWSTSKSAIRLDMTRRVEDFIANKGMWPY